MTAAGLVTELSFSLCAEKKYAELVTWFTGLQMGDQLLSSLGDDDSLAHACPLDEIFHDFTGMVLITMERKFRLHVLHAFQLHAHFPAQFVETPMQA